MMNAILLYVVLGAPVFTALLLYLSLKTQDITKGDFIFIVFVSCLPLAREMMFFLLFFDDYVYRGKDKVLFKQRGK